jgi:hypothetical protein
MRRVVLGFLVVAMAAGACSRSNKGVDNSIGRYDPTAPKSTSNLPAPVPARLEGRDVTIPSGTPLSVMLDTPVGSDTSTVEEPIRGHLALALAFEGQDVLPEGTRVAGVVTHATRSGKVKGVAHLGIRFDTISPVSVGESYSILTAVVTRTAGATRKKNAAAGRGDGTPAARSTSGEEIRLPKGTTLTFHLLQPVTVRLAN